MLLGFKKRFVGNIQLGSKIFTLRKETKRLPKIGETLHMYTGLRTANCELISNKEKLISIQKVIISINLYAFDLTSEGWFLGIMVDGRGLEYDEIEDFVRYDGFYTRQDFIDYWVKSSAPKYKSGPISIEVPMKLYHWTDLRF